MCSLLLGACKMSGAAMNHSSAGVEMWGRTKEDVAQTQTTPIVRSLKKTLGNDEGPLTNHAFPSFSFSLSASSPVATTIPSTLNNSAGVGLDMMMSNQAVVSLALIPG